MSSQESGGAARFEPIPDQARVVRQIFTWVGRDRLSLNQVARRLRQAGEPAATGKQWWSRTIVWHILQNPVYKGQAAYGRHTRSTAANDSGHSAAVHPSAPRSFHRHRRSPGLDIHTGAGAWSMNRYSMRLKQPADGDSMSKVRDRGRPPPLKRLPLVSGSVEGKSPSGAFASTIITGRPWSQREQSG
jgi:hypothetical protein